jgi:hypothetical protein
MSNEKPRKREWLGSWHAPQTRPIALARGAVEYTAGVQS